MAELQAEAASSGPALIPLFHSMHMGGVYKPQFKTPLLWGVKPSFVYFGNTELETLWFMPFDSQLYTHLSSIVLRLENSGSALVCLEIGKQEAGEIHTF